MKATRKITPEQFKASQAAKLRGNALHIRREIDAIASPLPTGTVNVGIALERLTDIFKQVNERIERHNAVWSERIQQVNEYRAWVASVSGNDEYLKAFDKLSTLDKMALFEYNRLINDAQS